MDARYIAIAIPLFFLAMAVEAFFARRRGLRTYRFSDSIASLACGIGQQVLGIALVVPTLLVYAWVQTRYGLFAISPASPLAWVAVLFLLDLCYWVFHWASHRVNFLWAAHAVHHQSEEYNLSTALRQSWFGAGFSWLFYLPLALLGFPPVMFVSMLTLNTLYQFWIHTRLVGRLGPLEWVLNTPSHHRVHHGIDPHYIDKNYAGIFIVWDKLFRTFTEETNEPAYGTVKVLGSWNALYANVAEWSRLFDMARATKNVSDKIAVWFAPPEWRPLDLGGVVTIPPVDPKHRIRYSIRPPRGITAFVTVQFVLVGLLLVGMLLAPSFVDTASQIALGVWIVVALIAWGGLLESKGWAFAFACAHQGLLVGVIAWTTRTLPNGIFFGMAAILLAGGCVVWLWKLVAPELSELPNQPDLLVHQNPQVLLSSPALSPEAQAAPSEEPRGSL